MYLGLHLIFRLKTLAKGIGDRSYAVEVDRPHLPLHPLKQAALAIARPSSFRPTKGCDMGSGYTGLLIYCNTVFFVSVFIILLTSLFAVFLVHGHTGLLIAPRASCVP